MKALDWLKKHGAALAAAAGALGALIANIDPAVAGPTGNVAAGIYTAIGILGAVVHAYAQSAQAPSN